MIESNKLKPLKTRNNFFERLIDIHNKTLPITIPVSLLFIVAGVFLRFILNALFEKAENIAKYLFIIGGIIIGLLIAIPIFYMLINLVPNIILAKKNRIIEEENKPIIDSWKKQGLCEKCGGGIEQFSNSNYLKSTEGERCSKCQNIVWIRTTNTFEESQKRFSDSLDKFAKEKGYSSYSEYSRWNTPEKDNDNERDLLTEKSKIFNNPNGPYGPGGKGY